MTIFLIMIGVGLLLAVGALLAMCAVRMDRALVARAEIHARQRHAEAEVQHLVQDTIQRMFDAARRQP